MQIAGPVVAFDSELLFTQGRAAMIGQAEAVGWARAYCFGHCRLEPYIPRAPIDEHPPDQFYFFAVVGAAYYVGGDHVIAVRKTDGKISCCGMVAGSRRDSHPLGAS